MDKDVVITGLGITTPIGCGVPQFWQALCNGTDGLGSISVCDLSDFTFNTGGEVAKIPAVDNFTSNDRASLLTIVAASEAISDAKLANFTDTAVVLASNFGSIATAEQDLGTDNPQLTGEIGFNSVVNNIAKTWNCQGPNVALSLSCSSGAAAIGHGAELIKNGRAESVIAGGYDAISRFAWSGLSVLRTMTQDKIRPFSKNRSGTLFSEGSGIVVLESLESAQKRQATIYAKLAGFGYNNNAYHITAPAKEGKGLADAMQMALQTANMSPTEIDHVNTHGTSTVYNDLTETQAIKSTLGKHAYNVPITSIKSMTGHLMGAAGSVEAIAAILSLIHNKIPPTINYQEKDPECDLPLVKDEPMSKVLKTVLTNSSGIGGNNVSLILKKWGN